MVRKPWFSFQYFLKLGFDVAFLILFFNDVFDVFSCLLFYICSSCRLNAFKIVDGESEIVFNGVSLFTCGFSTGVHW